MPAVLLALQEPPGEHRGAAEKRESNFFFSVLAVRAASEPSRSCVYVHISLLTERPVFRHRIQQSVGEQQERHPPDVHTHPDPGD